MLRTRPRRTSFFVLVFVTRRQCYKPAFERIMLYKMAVDYSFTSKRKQFQFKIVIKIPHNVNFSNTVDGFLHCYVASLKLKIYIKKNYLKIDFCTFLLSSCCKLKHVCNKWKFSKFGCALLYISITWPWYEPRSE